MADYEFTLKFSLPASGAELEVADLAGFTRQNMCKLMLSNISTFPAAVHEGNPSLWHLASVMTWPSKVQKREIDLRLLEVAEATMKLNIARETRKLAGASFPKDLEILFA